MPEQARFYVDVPLDNIDQTEDLLNAQGIQFCTIENMLHMPSDHLLDGIFTGSDGGYAQEKLNAYLEEQHHPERIRLPFYNMTPKARRDFLELVTIHASWQSEWEPDILEMDTAHVDDFIASHPETADEQPETL